MPDIDELISKLASAVAAAGNAARYHHRIDAGAPRPAQPGWRHVARRSSPLPRRLGPLTVAAG